LVEIIDAWLLPPIGNLPDIVMVLVVIGQVNEIAADKIIVHNPITIEIWIGKMSSTESWKSDVMEIGFQKGKSARLRGVVSVRSFY
jgi:hypothetical protein